MRYVEVPAEGLTGVRSVFEVADEVVHVEQTPYQHVLIIETKAFGKALFLDQVLNSAAVDEGLYHSALVHPGMFLHPRPERVLIGGGAEGATAREVLKHADVREVVMVDIDERVVSACREYLPEWHQGAFDDLRLRLFHKDVRVHLEEVSPYSLDVVVLDLGDPVSCESSQPGYTQEFFQLVRSRLKLDGILAMQAGEYTGRLDSNYLRLYATVMSVFPYALPYRVGISSFLGNWGFLVASGKPLLLTSERKLPVGLHQRMHEAKGSFPWFDADGFTSMTWLPAAERALLEARMSSETLINRDDERTLQTIEIGA